MQIKSLTAISLIGLILLFSKTTLAGPQAELVFGILPLKSPVTLFKQFAPLRDYLSQTLQREIVIETARNYEEFVARSQARRYDLLLTAPHFTLLALDSGHYDVRATYSTPLVAVVIVHRNNPIDSVQELANQRIATPPANAIITLAGKRYLAQQGLDGDTAPYYQTYQSHNASLLAVSAGRSDAAIASIHPFRHLLAAGHPLRRLATTPQLPAMGLLVARDLPAPLQQQFENSLTALQHSKEGRQILKQIGYPGFRTVTPQEFEPARAFLPATLKD